MHRLTDDNLGHVMPPHGPQTVPGPPPPPPHTPFPTFMQNRGQIPINAPVHKMGELRYDPQAAWERRQRGYSNEAGRQGRGRGGNNHFAYQDRSNFSERRQFSDNNTPRESPHRRQAQQGQQEFFHYRDGNRQSPPFDRNATPKADGRGLMQSNQRMVSEPINSRMGYPNDARLWYPDDSKDRQRPNSKPQDLVNTTPIRAHNDGQSQMKAPFEDDPSAIVCKDIKNPFSTYWYVGAPRSSMKGSDPEQQRTLYVQNFVLADLVSHSLKQAFERYGQVESIHCLYTRPQAFVRYVSRFSTFTSNMLSGTLVLRMT